MPLNDDLFLGVGNISHDERLNAYYQDFTPAIYHFEHNSIGDFDENGIPYLHAPQGRDYNIVYVVQYGLIVHDLMLKGENIEENKRIVKKCLGWLEEKKEDFRDSVVWRSGYNVQYDLPEGWISAMYQGQAISLFLRGYQLFGDEKYLEIAEKVFEFFKYDYAEGGARRIDENGCVWFEEYPSAKPSLVLNGYIYAVFGIYDLYRVTRNARAKSLFDQCVETLEKNLSKYDVGYWSVYDQMKEELVSYYYQKNVHIPLMEIMYRLTGKGIFMKYAEKWTKNLNSGFDKFIVQIMYRVQPRLKKWIKQE